MFVNVANHAVGCVNKHTRKPGWKPNTNALAAVLKVWKARGMWNYQKSFPSQLWKIVISNQLFMID
jgi:hypothetical protein